MSISVQQEIIERARRNAPSSNSSELKFASFGWAMQSVNAKSFIQIPQEPIVVQPPPSSIAAPRYRVAVAGSLFANTIGVSSASVSVRRTNTNNTSRSFTWPYDYNTTFVELSGIWNSIEAGGAFICGIFNRGLYVAGDNQYGQLGNGTSGENNVIPIITRIPNKRFKRVECGYNHTFALGEDNKWYAAGSNNVGQLGLGYSEDAVSIFTKLPDGEDEWDNVYPCKDFTIAKKGNELYVTGDGSNGAIGFRIRPVEEPGAILTSDKPFLTSFTKLPGLYSKVARLDKNTRNLVALSADNRTWLAGGTIAYGPQPKVIRPPLVIDGVDTSFKRLLQDVGLNNETIWTNVIASYERIYAFNEEDGWYAQGRNQFGQLGLYNPPGYRATYDKFTPLNAYWTDIVTGDYHTFSRAENGKWYGTGKNTEGQLGFSDLENRFEYEVVFNGLTQIEKVATSVGATFTFYNINEVVETESLLTFENTNMYQFDGDSITLISNQAAVPDLPNSVPLIPNALYYNNMVVTFNGEIIRVK